MGAFELLEEYNVGAGEVIEEDKVGDGELLEWAFFGYCGVIGESSYWC